ncbi:UNVERIFIED_CONTAM: hypothetical protein GTU68_000109, partial [Idotea baltica]|nr:hypothetical protein [Idotea baltica]
MKIIQYPKETDWQQYIERPLIKQEDISSSVQNIIKIVKEQGDAGVKLLTYKFDQIKLDSFQVKEQEFKNAAASITQSLKNAIETARKNIRVFHESQQQSSKPIETSPGVVCWQKSVGIEKVGLYIPGGTAPLFSTLLMLGIPAQIANCQEIIVCTPPNKEGVIDNTILYCCQLLGITQVYKVGGAQAIVALALGTESI